MPLRAVAARGVRWRLRYRGDLRHAALLMQPWSDRPCPPASAKQGAFALCRGVVARALDYNARVLPRNVLLPYARALDEKAAHFAAASFGRRPEEQPDDVREQLRFSVRFAGSQVDLSSWVLPIREARWGGACAASRDRRFLVW